MEKFFPRVANIAHYGLASISILSEGGYPCYTGIQMSYFRVYCLNIWLVVSRIKTSQKYLYQENKYFFESAIEKYNKTKFSIDYIWDFAKRFSKAMLKTLTWKEIWAIVKEFFREDVWGDSKRIFKSLKEIKSQSPRTFLKNSVSKIKEIPSNIKTAWDIVRKSSRKEKALIIAKIIFFALMIAIGCKIPDLDISLWGIGSHRHFFTHSALPILVIVLLGKLAKRISNHISSNCTEEDDDIKSFLEEIKKFINIAVSGAAIGVSAHLFKDLFIDNPQSIRGPWKREWIPDWLRKGYRFDDGYLFANGLVGLGAVHSRSNQKE